MYGWLSKGFCMQTAYNRNTITWSWKLLWLSWGPFGPFINEICLSWRMLAAMESKILWNRIWIFLKYELWLCTQSIPEIIWIKNVRAIVVCGFLMKSLKNHILKIRKKSWVLFESYLLNSTADSAQFEWKWAGLAVLFSR